MPKEVRRYMNPGMTDQQAYGHLLGQSRQIVALTAAVGVLAKSGGLDADIVAASIREAVDKALAGMSVTLEVAK